MNTKVRQVTNSSNLIDYKLPKALLKKLSDFDEMCNYMRLGGKEPPSEIRLFRQDYDAINDRIIQQSDKKQSASSVYWAGRKLLRG